VATIVAIVSDIHANSTVAVCPPRVRLDDGGDYVASREQRWIWRHWRDYWQAVAQRREGHRLIVILNGETVDNNYHPTTQLVTRNPADILRLGIETLQPMLDIIQDGDGIYVTRGTEAHGGQSSHLDETVANDIGAVQSTPDIYSHWQLRLDVEGVRFDVAHHPPGGGGRVPWTRGNFANRLAAAAMFDAMEAEERPPHLYVRGHVHRHDDSYDRFATRAIVTPSWQLTTSYGHRIGGGVLPIGGIIVTCDRGNYTLSKHYHRWPTGGYKRA